MPRKVRETKYIDISYENISSAIKKLEEVKEEFGEVTLHLYTEDDYGDERAVLTFEIERDETKQEKEERLGREKRQEEYDRKRFEELKKKFES